MPAPAAHPLMPPSRVAVVGGGVGGLAAALRLQAAGASVTLHEASAGLGGAIRTERPGPWLIEQGASVLADLPAEVEAMLESAGLLADSILIQPVGSRRYLVHRGRPVVVPSSPKEMLASPLLSLAGRVRMLKEPFIPRGASPEEESVAAFARRRFGDEVAARFFEPLVSGTSGADPEQVLVRFAMPLLAAQEQRAGSILKARLRAARQRGASGQRVAPPPRSWDGGLRTLVDRMANALNGTQHLGSPVVGVEPRVDGVELTDATGRTTRYDAAVLALPAVALGAIRFPAGVQQRVTPIASMPHASPITVALGYRRGQVAHPLDGYGLLAPASERRRVLSVQFTSSLFPGRAPADHVLLTATLGGARQPAQLALRDDELVAIAVAEVGGLLGVAGEPAFAIVQRWPAALPLAVSGHQARLDAASQVEAEERRLALTGAWRTGASLGEVMLGGLRAADRVLGR